MSFKRKQTSSKYLAMLPSPSVISEIDVEGRVFYVKRDELFDPFLSGNKYRKLHSLIVTPKEKYTQILSYGGVQSNAMLSLAALCRKKGWEFVYYTKPLPKTLRQNPQGNFKEALKLAMEHRELASELYRDFVASLHVTAHQKSFVVHQGGAVQEAREGLCVLAQEIKQQLQSPNLRHIKAVATPSGTGTTALFLAQALPEYRVYTTPCVGDAHYLKEEMHSLCDALPSNLVILDTPKKYHFAKPYREFYDIHVKLQNAGITFDLLYAPKMWLCLLGQTDEEILYIHSGGISGNETMLERYKRKNLTNLTNKDS